MARKYKVIVDREACIACGAAPAACPEIFYLADDNGKNSVIPKYEVEHTESISVGIVPEELYECAVRGAEVCPVNAIKVEPVDL